MYKSAYRYDDETIFYFDDNGNKYVARGGNLAWRIVLMAWSCMNLSVRIMAGENTEKCGLPALYR